MSTDGSTTGSAISAKLGLILVVCCAGQFMVVLDASVVNVALPSIKNALHFQPGALQWVINAYTIVFAGFLLLGGRLADLYGRRRVFLGGLLVFTLSSLVGGLAGNPTSLLIARGVQGLGAAVVAPATLTVLGTTFTESSQRARAFGTWSAVAAGGGAVGALIGGVITEYLSWRWILLVNVPIGGILCAGVLYAIAESRRDDAERRVDVLGALSITIGLIAMVYAVVQSQKLGWSDPSILTMLGVGIVLLVFFFVNEGKLAKQPLVPLTIFRSRSVSAANVVAFTSTAALWGTFYLFTLLLQLALGYTPLQTGLAYLPLSLGILLAARGIAPLVPRVGPRPVLVMGLLLSAASLVWLSHASVDSGFWSDVFCPSLGLGIGQGMISASVTIAGTAGVSYREQGLVSGLLNTNRQVGGAVGLAILAAIANAQIGTQLSQHALASGYDKALLVSAVFPLLGVLAAMAAPPVRKERSEQKAPARA